MKKIFTTISLAAMTFMATLPGMAQQQQQLTDEQKAEVIATVVPAIFDQVKQISGIDIKALANPTIENVLESPLFGIQNTLRANTATALTIQPDSVIVDLSDFDNNIAAMLGKVKITCEDYKTFDLTSIIGKSTTLSFPQKLSTNIMSMPISLTMAMTERNGLLPFSSLDISIDLGFLANLLPSLPIDLNIKNGSLVKLEESATNGVYTYNITFSESGKTLLGYLGVEDVTNFRVIADMTQQQAGKIGVNLLAVVSSTYTFPIGDADITLAADGSKEIITTNYTEGTDTVKDYDRISISAPTVNGTTMSTVRTYYKETETLPEKEEDWKVESIETTTLYNTTGNPIDPNNLIASIAGCVIKDMMAGNSDSFSMLVTEKGPNATDKEENVSGLSVETSMTGTQAAVATIEVLEASDDEAVANNDGLATVMSVKVTIPLKGETIKVDFIPKAADNNPIATMYVKSNLFGFATGNETITPELDAQIIVAENGLYINNCEKAQYSIVSMNGKVVANGIISGDGAFVATPSLQRGQIYIVTVTENGAKKSVKFLKK